MRYPRLILAHKLGLISPPDSSRNLHLDQKRFDGYLVRFNRFLLFEARRRLGGARQGSTFFFFFFDFISIPHDVRDTERRY